MASFSVKSFERKLKEMSARQDSVQTVSLWLIHHRAHSKTVVSLWHDHVKKAKPERRLILFYLANDVIQNSRKKGKEFSASFAKVLLDSMSYLRDSQIRPSVERVLKIWQERKVFEKEIVQKLIAQLYRVSKSESKAEAKENETTKAPAKSKRPVPTDYKLSKVVGAMVTMQELEAETQRRETKVTQLRLDASSSDGIKQLKDRAGGNRFSLEFEESSSKFEELAQALEEENHHRHLLISALEDGDAYYEAALKEATIIANAYRSFGNRLHAMKKKLDNKIRKFATAEKEAPVSAPKASFLASGLSGILEEVNKSPSGQSNKPKDDEKGEEKKDEKAELLKEKEKEKEKQIKEEKVVDPTVDHVEVSDMDIESDSDNEKGDTEPQQTPDTNSNTDGSTVSTPSVTPATVSQSSTQTNDVPKSTNAKPVLEQPPVSTSPSQQFGYTMTVNSTEETGAVSPASHQSAPSPEGSPELNLEQYEKQLEEPATKTVSAGSIDVTTNESFLTRPQSIAKASKGVAETSLERASEPTDAVEPDAEASSKPQNTVNLIAQLISKTRRQHNDSSVENSPQSAGETSGDGKPGDKPLLSLIDSLFPVLSTSLRTIKVSRGGKKEQSEEKKEQLMKEEAIVADRESASDERRSREEPGLGDLNNVVPSAPFHPGSSGPRDMVVRRDHVAQAFSGSGYTGKGVPPGSGSSTDDAQDGDNTPEHGSETPEFGESAPIIIRSGDSFPTVAPGIHPYSGPGPSRGRLSNDRAFMDDRRFLPRNSNIEPTSFVRDEIRRASINEAMLDEHNARGISPGIRSPRMVAPPVDWERWPPRDRFVPRDAISDIHDNGPIERRHPYPQIDRREEFRPREGPREFHPLERREMPHPMDQRPPLHPMGRREEFLPPERRGEPRPLESAREQREFPPLDRHREFRGMMEQDFPPMERQGRGYLIEGREQLPPGERLGRPGEARPLERRREFHPVHAEGELRQDFSPADRPGNGRKEFPPPGSRPLDPQVELRLAEERKDLIPKERTGDTALKETVKEFPSHGGPGEIRPAQGRNESSEIDRPGEFPPRDGPASSQPVDGRKEFPMQRPGDRPALDKHEEPHPMEFRRESGPMDGRIEPHPAERWEDFHPIERRDGFRGIPPVIRGGRGPPRGPNRPRPYRGPPGTEQTARGFRPRFSHPHAYRMGGPRGYGEIRLKRPGPPFNPDTAKRPHF